MKLLEQKANDYAAGGYHRFRGGDSLYRPEDIDPKVRDAFMEGYRLAIADASASVLALDLYGSSKLFWIEGMLQEAIRSLLEASAE